MGRIIGKSEHLELAAAAPRFYFPSVVVMHLLAKIPKIPFRKLWIRVEVKTLVILK
jgi:hypothetical protein